jgi:flagellar hook-associated protein 2
MAVSATSGGFDVAAIVSGLMAIERRPITTLNTREASFQSKLTALGLIKSQVASFQAAALALGSTSSSSFNAFKATASDPSIFSATAGSTAVAGIYSLEVSTLAQSQKLAAAGRVSATTAISDGTATTVSFDLGTISGGTLTAGIYSGATFTSNSSGIVNITIDGTNNTLEGIRDAINNAVGLSVSATIVNDGSGTPYRLALSSDNSGISNSIKITTSGGDGTIDTLLAHDPGGLPAAQHLNQSAAAQNANFTVNGIAVTKTSNSVTDAIQGVTLNLSKVTTTPASLTVERDTTAVTDKVTAFVKTYNDLFSAMKNSAAYKSKSALEGDATLRNMMTQMRNIAAGVVSGGTLANAFEVGLTFKVDGTLQLDSAKLSSALATDFNDVANLFNSATGYATQYNTWATATLAYDGSIATRTKTLDDSIKNIGTQRDALEVRMVRIEKSYRTQYSNLNVLLSQMGKTSEYLSNQLSRL